MMDSGDDSLLRIKYVSINLLQVFDEIKSDLSFVSYKCLFFVKLKHNSIERKGEER